VVAVGKRFFRDYYISQKILAELWGKALGDGYEPRCWVEKVKARKKKANLPTVTEDIRNLDNSMFEATEAEQCQPLINAAAETSKYAVKVADIISPKIKYGKCGDKPDMVAAKLALRADRAWQGRVLQYLIDALHKGVTPTFVHPGAIWHTENVSKVNFR
jgi:hypothetical protein